MILSYFNSLVDLLCDMTLRIFAVAAFRGKLGSIQALIEQGVSVDCRDVLGSTPLHLAALGLKTNAAIALVRIPPQHAL